MMFVHIVDGRLEFRKTGPGECEKLIEGRTEESWALISGDGVAVSDRIAAANRCAFIGFPIGLSFCLTEWRKREGA